MEAILDKQAPSKRLGFEKLETVEIVSRLNKTLSTYQVFYHKLQNFHWNVVGGDFFDIHEITETLYSKAVQDIDEIAERIRIFGEKPKTSLQHYIEDSLITQNDEHQSGQFMAKELISDMEILTETFLDAYEFATKNGDVGTSYMMSKMVKEIEKFHWQLSAWTNKKFDS